MWNLKYRLLLWAHGSSLSLSLSSPQVHNHQLICFSCWLSFSFYPLPVVFLPEIPPTCCTHLLFISHQPKRKASLPHLPVTRLLCATVSNPPACLSTTTSFCKPSLHSQAFLSPALSHTFSSIPDLFSACSRLPNFLLVGLAVRPVLTWLTISWQLLHGGIQNGLLVVLGVW